MKRPGLWFLCVGWVAFALTELLRAVAGPDTFRALDIAMTAVMALFFTLLFGGLALWVPRMRVTSLTRTNLEYWQAPEHRRQLNATLAGIFRGIAAACVLMPTLLNVGRVIGFPSWFGFAVVATLMAALFAVMFRGARRLGRLSAQRGLDSGGDGRG
jgi:hypothetical protein